MYAIRSYYVGEVSNPVACPEDMILYLTAVALSGGIADQGVDLICRQPVNLSQLADDGFAPEGVDSTEEGSVTMTITPEDIFGDGVTLLP